MRLRRFKPAIAPPRQWVRCSALLIVLAASSRAAHAAEDIEFIAEHLAEAPMDQRLASLPVFYAHGADSRPWQWQLGGAYSSTSAGRQKVAGGLFSIATRHPLNERWSLILYGFYDRLRFSGAAESRPLQVSFTQGAPLSLPADATIGGFSGHLQHVGGGALLQRHVDGGRLGDHNWMFGLQLQRLSLKNFRSDFAIAAGPDSGVTGVVDYSGDYNQLAPLIGMSLPRSRGSWILTPHVLAAFPLPRRGISGRINTVSFDLAGDSDAAGNGKHFGDPYVALGFSVGYAPWRLSLDIGATLAQRLIEKRIHKGIDQNWLVSMTWNF